MASTDARPVPIKNTAMRIYFAIVDADGDLVTGATGLDSEVSKDGGTFADCTNEATEIATSSGVYYLELSSTEMNADSVCVIIKTTSVGAKTTVVVMYPQEAGDIKVDVETISGDSAAADALEAVLDNTGAAVKITALTVTAGVDVTQSTGNGAGVTITGNGTGHGVVITSGNGVTGDALRLVANSTNGQGLAAYGVGTGHGIYAYGGLTGNGLKVVGGDTSGDGALFVSTVGAGLKGSSASGSGIMGQGGGTGHGMDLQSGTGTDATGLRASSNAGDNGWGATFLGAGGSAGVYVEGGATGPGMRLVGGDTSGPALRCATTSGNAIELAPTAGHGISAVANGTDKHGIYASGGTAGTCDGMSLVAGTGGVAFRGSGLEYLFSLAYNPAAKPGNASGLLNVLVEDDSGVPRYTANALELAPTDGAPMDADDIRDAIGLATANLDTQLAALDAAVGDVDTAVGDVGTDVGVVSSALAGLITTVGTAGAGLNDIPWNADWNAEVQSEVDDALRALHLHHLFETAYDPTAEPGNAAGLLNVLVENDAGVPRFTANALEQGSGGGLSAEAVAEAVWSTLTADIEVTGSFGVLLSELFPDTYDTLQNSVTAVLAQLDDIETTQAAHGGVLDRVPMSPAAVGSAMTLADDAITFAKIADGAFKDEHFEVPTLTGPAEGLLSMVVQTWRRHFMKVRLDASTLVTYADDGTTPITTQARSESTGVQTLGEAI